MSDFGAHLQHLCYDFFNANFIGGYVMSERLPGNLQERLRELREEHGYSSKEQLADALGINRSTYGRIENGTTKTISSELLIKLAELYDVSADYILGISNTPERTYYDIGELGMSVDAALNLYSGKVSRKVLNELLLNNKFAVATKMMENYFSTVVAGIIKTQNQLLDFNYDLISYLTENGELPNDEDIRNLKKKTKSAKVPMNRYELDSISRQFNVAVKEIENKVKDEVKEYQQNQELLYYDILKQVKEKAENEIVGLKDLPEAKKKKFVMDIMKNILRDSQTIPEENLEKAEALIDQMTPALLDLWKDAN